MVKKEEFEQAINSLKDEISQLKSLINERKDDVVSALMKENASLKNQVKELKQQSEDHSISLNKIDQYSRRNNIIIEGIPSDVDNQHLEKKVIGILAAVNIKVNELEIETTHRLGKSKKTIIRFVNRKNCSKLLSKKKELSSLSKRSLQELGFSSETQLYVQPNLTPFDEKIGYYCRELRRKKLIEKTWFYSGCNYIKLVNSSETAKIEVNHLNQLVHLFPNFTFNSVEDKN